MDWLYLLKQVKMLKNGEQGIQGYEAAARLSLRDFEASHQSCHTDTPLTARLASGTPLSSAAANTATAATAVASAATASTHYSSTATQCGGDGIIRWHDHVLRGDAVGGCSWRAERPLARIPRSFVFALKRFRQLARRLRAPLSAAAAGDASSPSSSSSSSSSRHPDGSGEAQRKARSALLCTEIGSLIAALRMLELCFSVAPADELRALHTRALEMRLALLHSGERSIRHCAHAALMLVSRDPFPFVFNRYVVSPILTLYTFS